MFEQDPQLCEFAQILDRHRRNLEAALGFGNDTSWRASRQKSQCTSTSAQTTDTVLGSNVQYFCLYQTARLTYSATVISTP